MSMIAGAAEKALKDFGGEFFDGTLLVPGDKVPDGQGGFTATAAAEHGCKALVTDYDDYRRQTLGIFGTDRLVLVLGASLPDGVIPLAGHKITAPDPANGFAATTFDVIAKNGDPAGALYRLQGR